MSAWPGKYIIGLTGNIATGKSVVRKMLEHLGAYGIDADALGHRAIAKDAPGYQPVLAHFGQWILGADKQIDRAKLARVVFADPDALRALEDIVHPLVRQAVQALVSRAKQSVIVIEAIKLLESPLRQYCDSLWVAHAPQEAQVARLVQKRGLSEEAARQRVAAQPAQEQKLAVADVIIRNDSGFENTWRQVVAFWQQEVPAILAAPPAPPPPTAKGELAVERARPKQAAEVASLLARLSGGRKQPHIDEIMAAFGEKAYLILRMDGRPMGLAGWQVENLVSRTDDVYLDPAISLVAAMRALMNEVERTSRDLQCEASLLFLPLQMARHEDVWRTLGYEHRTIQSLGVRAWQEAAQESMPQSSAMLFKQLRKDRVLRPV